MKSLLVVPSLIKSVKSLANPISRSSRTWKLAGVMFDIDGTLVKSDRIHQVVFHKLLLKEEGLNHNELIDKIFFPGAHWSKRRTCWAWLWQMRPASTRKPWSGASTTADSSTRWSLATSAKSPNLIRVHTLRRVRIWVWNMPPSVSCSKILLWVLEKELLQEPLSLESFLVRKNQLF